MAIQGDVCLAEVGEVPDMVREVHHQVKNTLQVVCSLLRLEGRGVSDPSAQDLVRRSEARVQAMSLVYDTLYRAGAFLEVPLDRYLRSLTDQVVRGWRSSGLDLAVEYSMEPVVVSTKAAISCGLILNELLNMLRGRVGDAGLHVHEGRLDRGVFLEVAADTLDDEPPNHERLSEQIVQALAQQYGGRMVVLKAELLRYRIELPTIAE